MPQQTYRYSGPNSAVTLVVSDGAGGQNDQDVLLWHDQDVVLSSDHEVTQVLLQRGWLELLPQADKVAAAPATATTATTTTKAK